MSIKSLGETPTMNSVQQESSTPLDAPAVEETKKPQPDPAVSERTAQAESARSRAAQLLTERRFSEAKSALAEADQFEAAPAKWKIERAAQAEAARTRAAQMLTERRFSEAKSALEEAEKLDGDPPKWKTESHRMISSLRAKLPKLKSGSATAEAAKDAEGEETGVGAVNKSLEIVSFYSKLAAGVGLLPGGLLNFAGVLAVEATMVWKIANEFGHTEGKERIRGSILSLIGAVIPAGIGHGAGLAIAAIPALITGTVVYFVATPILAYAMTQAIGNAFIMHFESGGTLLTFDPKAFGDYFLKEYKKAGGLVAPEAPEVKPV